MTTRPPAEIGMPLDEVDTPALVSISMRSSAICAACAERRRAAGSGCGRTPRPINARSSRLKQIELGAVGVCCQKVSEAEAMVYGGVKDVLVTNEIVGRQKLRRLMALAGSARIGVCVDDPAQVARSRGRAGEAGIDPTGACRGQHGRQPLRRRAGRSRRSTSRRRIVDAPHLRFAGLQAYHGSAQHLRSWDERQKAIASAVDKAG